MSQTSISGVPVYEVIKPDGTPLGAWALPDILRFYSSGEWDGDYLAQIPRVKGMTPIRKLLAEFSARTDEWVRVPCTHWCPFSAWWYSVCHLFDMKGRAGREEFFHAVAGHIFSVVVWYWVASYLRQLIRYEFEAYDYLAGPVLVMCFICNLVMNNGIALVSLCVRRLHDVGKRGVCLPLCVCSGIGIPLLLVWLCSRGTEANRYGERAQSAPLIKCSVSWLNALCELHTGVFRLAGRCSGGVYWGMLAGYVLSFVAFAGLCHLMPHEEPLPEAPSQLLRVVVLVFMLYVWLFLVHLPTLYCATVRRLHDTGRSAWWMLMILFPPALLILLLGKSEGPNQYDDTVLSFHRRAEQSQVAERQPRWTLPRILVSAFLRFDDCEGRAGRREFFFFAAFCSVVVTCLRILYSYTDEVTGDVLGSALRIAIGVIAVCILLPLLSMSIRRIHDAACSAWGLAVVGIPAVLCLIASPFWPTQFGLIVLLPSLLSLLSLPPRAANPYASEAEWPLW